MNVIAIMNHMGVYFKEEPIRELLRRWKVWISASFTLTIAKTC
ncbi:lysine decarboxylase [Serratia marcescens]|nr:lysine decarboxylase [Serratia marcescens]